MNNNALLKSKLWPVIAKHSQKYLVERHHWEETNHRTLVSENIIRVENELRLLLYMRKIHTSKSVYIQSVLRDIKGLLPTQ